MRMRAIENTEFNLINGTTFHMKKDTVFDCVSAYESTSEFTGEPMTMLVLHEHGSVPFAMESTLFEQV